MTPSYRLLQIYGEKLPDFLQEAAASPLMQRLRGVGMNCGCEYTSFPRFAGLGSYSRFDHSLGTALIVWRFTHDKAQALAGLLHDAATPAFAHVIDFLRGDYLTQEATEAGTEEAIRSDAALQVLLRSLHLRTEDVSDYHRYPIADNDSPRLSADRLEYSLGNMVNFGIRSMDAVRRIYDDLTVVRNEDGTEELAFLHPETAADFSSAALECAKIYVCDDDRYAMQMLAELIRSAVADGIVAEKDLYGTEAQFLEKLCLSPDYARRWADFRALARTERSDCDRGGAWRQIFAKKRCINPLIAGLGRTSAVDPAFRAALAAFRASPQEYRVCGYPEAY